MQNKPRVANPGADQDLQQYAFSSLSYRVSSDE